MQDLTPNQVIVLFDCYRGFSKETHCGTMEKDIKLLRRLGLIDIGQMKNLDDGLDVVCLTTTEKGSKVVRSTIAHITRATRTYN